jgi:thiol:disulfide interchange protein
MNAGAQFADPFSFSASLDKSSADELILTVEFGVPAEHYLYADQLKIRASDDVALRSVRLPQAKRKFDATFDKILNIYEGRTVFVYSTDANLELPLAIDVEYQGCSSNLCFPPQSRRLLVDLEKSVVVDAVSPAQRPDLPITAGWEEKIEQFTVQGLAVGYLNVEGFTAELDRIESGSGEGQRSFFDFFVGKGSIILILGVVIAGLTLNLTPCVLPMIPINLAIIGAGVQDDAVGSERTASRVRGFALGLTYGAGIACAYGLLGLLVVIGANDKLGSLNASPVFNLGIAVVFLLLSLAMFGVFNLDFTRFQGGGPSESKRGKFGAAFVLGAIAALLAGACVAPAVIAVLVQSTILFDQGVRIGLLLPFLLGVGMALPWPFAGAGLSFLPKAGAWMERVKRVFGVMILAAALYYGHLGYSLLVPHASAPGQDAEGWYHSLDTALEIAEREEKPVFVDIWASWCKACTKMDATTFKDPEVIRRLAKYVKVRFVAEKQKDPSVKAVLNRFVKVGLPTYVILGPKEQ